MRVSVLKDTGAVAEARRSPARFFLVDANARCRRRRTPAPSDLSGSEQALRSEYTYMRLGFVICTAHPFSGRCTPLTRFMLENPVHLNLLAHGVVRCVAWDTLACVC